ncbi:hypothetical protein F4806DRAFT_504998 [Annulohypoxylon nitens]|nr:hypothetical protein F4806DRAFT_504998 [Annulohypoxylon nitens]
MAVEENRLTIERIVHARLVAQRWRVWRCEHYGRWDVAFRQLDQKDQNMLRAGNDTKSPFKAEKVTELTDAVKKAQQTYEKGRYTLFVKRNGTKVKIHDISEKIVDWAKRFEKVADTVSSFDPIHAALPWAAVTTYKFDTYTKMTEALEYVSRIITCIAEVEKLFLSKSGFYFGFRCQLSQAIIHLYVEVLKFLAVSKHFFTTKGSVKTIKDMFEQTRSTVNKLIETISSEVLEIFRLSGFVDLKDRREQGDTRHTELMSTLSYILSKITEKPTELSLVNQSRNSIHAWLNPVYTDEARNTILKYRHGSTCDWILQNNRFAEWSNRDKNVTRIFWLYGPPGFGKSVLCARIVNYMEHKSDIYGRVYSFFCSAEKVSRQQPYAILKSWIAQLISRSEDAAKAVMENQGLVERMSQEDEVEEEGQDGLWPLFREIIERTPRCTLVIDGYDECIDTRIPSLAHHEEDCRHHFLQELSKSLAGTGTLLLLVSRDDCNIVAMKETCEQLEAIVMTDYPITKEDTSADVAIFSEASFHSKLRQVKEGDRNTLASKAAEKSDGMFLWMYLLTKELANGTTKKAVEMLVTETPRSINETYKKELRKMLDPNIHKASIRSIARTVVILKWIMFANRPLTVQEMAEALANAFNDNSSTYPDDDLPISWVEDDIVEAYVAENIRKFCGSLIEIRKKDKDTPLSLQTIHFVHSSVKEYLLQSRFCMDYSDRKLCFGDNSTEQNWIASLCLRYMSYDEIGEWSSKVMNDKITFLKRYPFYFYAASNWYEHYLQGRSDSRRDDLQHMPFTFFDQTHWKMWAQLLEEWESNARDALSRTMSQQHFYADLGCRTPSDCKQGSEGELERAFRDNAEELDASGIKDLYSSTDRGQTVDLEISPSPVYYTALLGLNDIVDRLIRCGYDCNQKGGKLGTPLQAAVVRQHMEIVRTLISHRANPSQEGGIYGTPLIAAVTLGSTDIFNELIQACVNLGTGIDTPDSDANTALHHACELGHLHMVQKLVESGASLDSTSSSSRTPLVQALHAENIDVTLYLLEKGADVNEKDRAQTPLQLAIELNNEHLVTLLLENKADLGQLNCEGASPLHTACYCGLEAMAQLLIDHNASVQVKDSLGRTPLHYAVFANSTKCVSLLLRHSSSPLAQDNLGAMPFGVAMRFGAAEIMDLFEAYEEDSPSSEESLNVRVKLALDEGELGIVKSLVKHLTHLSTNIEIFKDVLALVLRTGDQDIYDQLIGKVLEEVDHGRAVDQVLWSREEEKTLLISPWGNDSQKKVALDPAWKHLPRAREVISGVLLHIAVTNRDQDAVQLLLEAGADMCYSSRIIPSAIQLAIDQNSHIIVAKLLDRGRRGPNFDSFILQSLETACRYGGIRLSKLATMLTEYGVLDGPSGSQSAEAPRLNDNFGLDKSLDVDHWEHILIGEWRGYYTYFYEKSDETTSFIIDSVSKPSHNSQRKDLVTFSGKGEDYSGTFEIYGQTTHHETIRYIKLYKNRGWMYEGEIDVDKSCIEGTWSARFGDTTDKNSGEFNVQKKTIS